MEYATAEVRFPHKSKFTSLTKVFWGSTTDNVRWQLCVILHRDSTLYISWEFCRRVAPEGSSCRVTFFVQSHVDKTWGCFYGNFVNDLIARLTWNWLGKRKKRLSHWKSGFNICAQQLAILKENERHWKQNMVRWVYICAGTINRSWKERFRQSANTGIDPPERLRKNRST